MDLIATAKDMVVLRLGMGVVVQIAMAIVDGKVTAVEGARKWIAIMMVTARAKAVVPADRPPVKAVVDPIATAIGVDADLSAAAVVRIVMAIAETATNADSIQNLKARKARFVMNRAFFSCLKLWLKISDKPAGWL